MKFSKPYINCIPEMIKWCMKKEYDDNSFHLCKSINKKENQEFIMQNIIKKLMNDKSYFFSENYFTINFIEFNNLKNYNPIDVKIEFLFTKNTDYGKIHTEKIKYLDEIDDTECLKCQKDILLNKTMNELVIKTLKNSIAGLKNKDLDDILIENDRSIYAKKKKCVCNSEERNSQSSKYKHMRLVIFFIFYFNI